MRTERLKDILRRRGLAAGLLALFFVVSGPAFAGWGDSIWTPNYFFRKPDFAIRKPIGAGDEEKYEVITPEGRIHDLRLHEPIPLYAEVPAQYLAKKLGLPSPLAYPVVVQRGDRGLRSAEEAKAAFPKAPYAGTLGVHGEWFPATLQPHITPSRDSSLDSKWGQRNRGELMGHLLYNYLLGNTEARYGKELVNGTFEASENQFSHRSDADQVFNTDMTKAFKRYHRSESGAPAMIALLETMPPVTWEQLKAYPPFDDRDQISDQKRLLDVVSRMDQRLSEITDAEIEKLFGTYFNAMDAKRKAAGKEAIPYRQILRGRIDSFHEDLLQALQHFEVHPDSIKRYVPKPVRDPERPLDLSEYPQTHSLKGAVPTVKNGQHPQLFWDYFFEDYWRNRDAAAEVWRKETGLAPGVDVISALRAHPESVKISGVRDKYLANPEFQVATENGRPKVSPSDHEERYIVATPQTGLDKWMVLRINSPEKTLIDFTASQFAKRLGVPVVSTYPVLAARGQNGVPPIEVAIAHPEASATAGSQGAQGFFPALLQQAPPANHSGIVSGEGRQHALVHVLLAYALGDSGMELDRTLEHGSRWSEEIFRRDSSALLQDFQTAGPRPSLKQMLDRVPENWVWARDRSSGSDKLRFVPPTRELVQLLVNLESLTPADIRRDLAPAFDAINHQRKAQGLATIDFETAIRRRIEEIRPALVDFYLQRQRRVPENADPRYKPHPDEVMKPIAQPKIPRLNQMAMAAAELAGEPSEGAHDPMRDKWRYFFTTDPTVRAGIEQRNPEFSKPQTAHGKKAPTPAPAHEALSLANQAVNRLKIAPEKFQEEVGRRIHRMPEIPLIAAEAERRNLRVWLFGGSAAAGAHYIKWDLMREQGDPHFQYDSKATENAVDHRFDYHYSSMFRSTQDLDLAADGSPNQIADFAEWIRQRFPYVEGDKKRWEVRPLREAHEDKYAILGDSGFQNQHTDSNSTGMIELTKPPPGEPVIRDARDFNTSIDPIFLRDVIDGELHFYYSDLHRTTPRFLRGLNPEIFAVVRFLTKAFQFETQIKPEQFGLMRKLIEEFHPQRDIPNDEARAWLIKNGKKLFQHAVDVEYAWNTLEKLGLREKLMKLDSPQEEGSLAWWMNKEPLRSKRVGMGKGQTARELGLSLVSHETKDYLAYESITRSHTGRPNVFASRDGAVGESSSWKITGFYTKTGKEGAAGTGITTRYLIDPNARAGSDFEYEGHVVDGKLDGIVVMTNKDAYRVVPESLVLDPLQYFEVLLNQGFDQSNKALVERLELAMNRDTAGNHFDPKLFDAIAERILQRYRNGEAVPEEAVKRWFALPASRRHPALTETIAQHDPKAFFEATLRDPLWRKHSDFNRSLAPAIAHAGTPVLLNILNGGKELADQARRGFRAEGEESKALEFLAQRPDAVARIKQILEVDSGLIVTINGLASHREWDGLWKDKEVLNRVMEFFANPESVRSAGGSYNENLSRDALRKLGPKLFDTEAAATHPLAPKVLLALTREISYQAKSVPLEERTHVMGFPDLTARSILGSEAWYRHHRDLIRATIGGLLGSSVALHEEMQGQTKSAYAGTPARSASRELFELGGVLRRRQWVEDPEFDEWVKKMEATKLPEILLPTPAWVLKPDIMRRQLDAPYDAQVQHRIARTLNQDAWLQHPRGLEFVLDLIRREGEHGGASLWGLSEFSRVWDYSDAQAHHWSRWFDRPEKDIVLSALIDAQLAAAKREPGESGAGDTFKQLLLLPQWAGTDAGAVHLKRLVDSGIMPFKVVAEILTEKPWYSSPHLPELLLSVVDQGTKRATSDDISTFNQRNWRVNQDTLLVWIQEKIVENPSAGKALIEQLQQHGIMNVDDFVPNGKLHGYLKQLKDKCGGALEKLAKAANKNP